MRNDLKKHFFCESIEFFCCKFRRYKFNIVVVQIESIDIYNKNCTLNEISISWFLHFKLKKKQILTNRFCQIYFYLSITIEITFITKKHIKKHQTFHFYHFTSNNSNIVKKKDFSQIYVFLFTKIQEIWQQFKFLKNKKIHSIKNIYHNFFELKSNYYFVFWFHIQRKLNFVKRRYRAKKIYANSSTSKIKKRNQNYILHCKTFVLII